MMRVKVPLFACAKGVSRVPHSWGSIVTLVVGMSVDVCRRERLWSILKAIALDNAGEEGWSVMVTLDAWERAQMSEGRAVPVHCQYASSMFQSNIYILC